MNQADSKLIYEKNGVYLLEVTKCNGDINYAVTGDCSTRYFEDYDDALEYYNYCWIMKDEKYN